MKIFLFVLAGVVLLGAGPDKAAAGKEKRYVINVAGATVHRQPSFASATVQTIPVGASLEIQETLAPAVTRPLGTGFGLPGRWMKVTMPSSTGYVFSSDVTAMKPAVEKSGDGFQYINLLGAKKGSRQTRPGAGKERTITEYANATYATTSYDGCFDHNYTFRKLALHEVYHQMVNTYSGYKGQQLTQPTLISVKGSVYTFTCGFGDRDATQELKLTVNKDGSLVISSYDCT